MWLNSLLDLSLRNSLLNFRPRVGTLNLVPFLPVPWASWKT